MLLSVLHDTGRGTLKWLLERRQLCEKAAQTQDIFVHGFSLSIGKYWHDSKGSNVLAILQEPCSLKQSSFVNHFSIPTDNTARQWKPQGHTGRHVYTKCRFFAADLENRILRGTNPKQYNALLTHCTWWTVLKDKYHAVLFSKLAITQCFIM